MAKRITQRRKSKSYCNKNVISSANSVKMSESSLSVPVFVSDSHIIATDDNSVMGRQKQHSERCLKTNLSVNNIVFENLSNVPDICVSVQSSDKDSGKHLDDKSEMNSRKPEEIKFEAKQNLNNMSTEKYTKIPNTCQCVQYFESYSRWQMKHDNTQNVDAYSKKQNIVPKSIKMEMPENYCITEHGQNIGTNNKSPMSTRKTRERKCKTNLSLNEVACKNSENTPVVSQSVKSLNSNSTKQFNYNDKQNTTIDTMKQLIIPIKDIKLEMPEYNSIVEHCKSTEKTENSASVKRASRERKCKNNLNTNDITADKSAVMPITCPSAQVSTSDYQMIEPADNSTMDRRKLRERKSKTNFSQNYLSTENFTKRQNTNPTVQMYDSYGENIATIDNSAISRRRNTERNCKTNRSHNGELSGSSAKTPYTCTASQSFNTDSTSIFHHANPQAMATDTIKQLIIPVKGIKKEMPEYNSDEEHYQTVATNDNSAMERRKSKGRKCKTNHRPNDILFENPSRMRDECPTAQSFGKYSTRFFDAANAQNTATDIIKELIIPVKRIKMEMPEYNFLTEHCQRMSTNDNYAVDKRKGRERKCKTKLSSSERSSGNTAKMFCPCPSLEKYCESNAANDDPTVDRRKSKEQTFKANQSLDDISPENCAVLQNICPTALDRDSRRCFQHSDMKDMATNTMKQLIIPIRDIKMEMPENNNTLQHCQNMATSKNYSVDKRKSGIRDISSENTTNISVLCSSLQPFANDCQITATNGTCAIDILKCREQNCKANQRLNDMPSENSTVPLNTCPASFDSHSRRFFHDTNIQDITSNSMKQLIIPVKDIKWEMPENNYIVQHCQIMGTNENNAVDKRKTGMRNVSSENTAKIPGPCSSLQSFKIDCQNIVKNDTSAIDILKSQKRKCQYNDNLSDVTSKNSENMRNARASVQVYDNDCQVIEPNVDNYKMNRRKRIDRKCKMNLTFNDVTSDNSKTIPDICPSYYSFDNNSRRQLGHNNSKRDRESGKSKCKTNLDIYSKSSINESEIFLSVPSFDDDSRSQCDFNNMQNLGINTKEKLFVQNTKLKKRNTKMPEYITGRGQNIVDNAKEQLISPIKDNTFEIFSPEIPEYNSSLELEIGDNLSANCTHLNISRSCEKTPFIRNLFSEKSLHNELDCENTVSSILSIDSVRCTTKYMINEDTTISLDQNYVKELTCNKISDYPLTNESANDDFNTGTESLDGIRKIFTEYLNFSNDNQHFGTCQETILRKESEDIDVLTHSSASKNLIMKNDSNKFICSVDTSDVTHTKSSDADERIDFSDNETSDILTNKREISVKKNFNSENLKNKNICKVTDPKSTLINSGFSALIAPEDISSAPQNKTFLKYSLLNQTSNVNSEKEDVSLEKKKNSYYMTDKNSSINKMSNECLDKIDWYESTEAKDESDASCTNINSDKNIRILKQSKSSLTGDFLCTTDINKYFINQSSFENFEENIASPVLMIEKDIHVNDKSIESLKNTNCSECIEAVNASIATGSKTFSSVNDVSNNFVEETSFVNFKKRATSLENSRSSEYCIDESVPITQEITNDDEGNINTKDDTLSETLVTCNMSMKQNSEIEFKIKVTRKIKKSEDDCSNKSLKICKEQYIEKNIESEDYLINSKPQSVSLMQSSPSEFIECNCNVNASENDTEPILSGNDTCYLVMDEASVLDNKKEDSLKIQNNSQSIMVKNIKEITNNDGTKSIEANDVSNRPLKRGVELEENIKIARKSIKTESDITNKNKRSEDILTNSKIASLQLVQFHYNESMEKNINADQSEIHTESSSCGTCECHLTADKASVYGNENTESGINKNCFENAMEKSILVKAEISNDDRATSVGTDDLPNMTQKGSVQFEEKNEISRKIKETKSCIDIDKINKTTGDKLQNTEVRSIASLQKPSRECNSMAGSSDLYNERVSSGTGSCSLIMDEASPENENNSEILVIKNMHIKEEITNEHSTKSVQSDKLSNILQQQDIQLKKNTEITRKRKKTEHDFINKDKSILQELHLHLEKQKSIVDALRNITRDINVRILQKSFTEICNNKDCSSRCHTNIFSTENDANDASVNIASNESKLRNELSENNTISRNFIDKAVVIKKEAIGENEIEEKSKGTNLFCSRLGKSTAELAENKQINRKSIKNEPLFATFEKVINVPMNNRPENVDEDRL